MLLVTGYRSSQGLGVIACDCAGNTEESKVESKDKGASTSPAILPQSDKAPGATFESTCQHESVCQVAAESRREELCEVIYECMESSLTI